jgi:hypothetical protein
MDLDPDNPLAIEIRQEMAEACFAACRKMVASLEAMKAFNRAVASSTLDHGQITRRAELLEAARELVFFVVVQREAMNLSCFEQFFKDYEIPDEVRTRLGPRRQEQRKCFPDAAPPSSHRDDENGPAALVPGMAQKNKCPAS